MTGKSFPYLKPVLCAAVIGYLLLTAASIRTRLPWVDEALFASPAYNLVAKGYMGTSVMETAGTRWKGIDRYTYWTVPLHFLAQAGWYRVFGFGLFSQRALSAAWGLVALAAFFATALLLSGDARIAALAAALIALDTSFIATAASGRMDMMNAALGMAGLAAYLSLRERRLPLAVLTGNSLVCAAGLTHPNGILYLASLAALILYFDRRRISWRVIALTALPYIIGAAGWGLYILRDPALFATQFTGNMSNGPRLSYLKAPWLGLWTEFVHRYLGYFGLAPESTGLSRLKLIIPVVQVAAVVSVASMKNLRKHAGLCALLVIVAVHFLMLAVYDGQKLPYYLIHTVPLLDVILAAWAVSWWPHRAPIVAVALTAFVGIQLLTSAQRIRQNPYRNSYQAAVHYLRENGGDRTLTMGSSALDYELGFDGAAIDDPRLGYYSGKTPGFIVVGQVEYAEYFESYRIEEPAVYQHIVQRLANEYRLVYDQAGQKIYARR
jgi:hypothetical protein